MARALTIKFVLS